MDDLISRAAAIDALKRAAYWQDGERKIAELPAVDVAPVVHARWIKATFEKAFAGYTKVSIYYVCSACGKDVDDAMFNYCPECGARMDGERRDSE